jgi:hypothetical protein
MTGPLVSLGKDAATCEGGICDLPGPAAKAAPKPLSETGSGPDNGNASRAEAGAPAQDDGADAEDGAPR